MGGLILWSLAAVRGLFQRFRTAAESHPPFKAIIKPSDHAFEYKWFQNCLTAINKQATWTKVAKLFAQF